MATDYEYATEQAKKALHFVREAPKKNGKLKDRKLASMCAALLRAMRAKDEKEILKHARDIFGRA